MPRDSEEVLRRIAGFFPPVNNGLFRVGQFIRAGMPGIKGVGPKLAKEIEDLAEDYLGRDFDKGTALSLFQDAHEVSTDLPVLPDLGPCNPELSWWELYSLLAWPSEKVLKAMPTGSQLGCVVAYQGEKWAIRVQIDWEEGHNIGRRPSEPDWKWKAGTIFAISEL